MLRSQGWRAAEHSVGAKCAFRSLRQNFGQIQSPSAHLGAATRWYTLWIHARMSKYMKTWNWLVRLDMNGALECRKGSECGTLSLASGNSKIPMLLASPRSSCSTVATSLHHMLLEGINDSFHTQKTLAYSEDTNGVNNPNHIQSRLRTDTHCRDPCCTFSHRFSLQKGTAYWNFAGQMWKNKERRMWQSQVFVAFQLHQKV